jgi:MEMO1 family protein
MRPPAVAGSFYPAERGALDRTVEASFLHPLGPGGLPPPVAPRRPGLSALIVPHAGFRYSGPIAAHAFAALAADGLPDALVIVGPNHRGVGGLADLSSEDWRTPLGTLRQHAALRDALAGGIVEVDDAAHAPEHSVEVQVPFLQWLATRAERELPFVPMLMALQDETTAAEVGEALAGAIQSSGIDAVLVASSDLMHAGPNYDARPPRGQRVDAFARERDGHALKAIEAMEPAKVLDACRVHDINMCGAGPVAAVLDAAKRLGATRAELLAHATSYDIEPHHSCVGYAAFAVR